jgi:hypothetical protein
MSDIKQLTIEQELAVFKTKHIEAVDNGTSQSKDLINQYLLSLNMIYARTGDMVAEANKLRLLKDAEVEKDKAKWSLTAKAKGTWSVEGNDVKVTDEVAKNIAIEQTYIIEQAKIVLLSIEKEISNFRDSVDKTITSLRLRIKVLMGESERGED